MIEPVYCSCGEIFDWENWDRKTFPIPKGLHESIRHLDQGHTLMSEMKVYVVLKEMDYAVHWVRGVFSSEPLAEEFIEEKKQVEGAWNNDVEDVWRIEKWEVDEKKA